MRKELILCLLVIINATNVQSTRVAAGQLSEYDARALLTALNTVQHALPVIFFAIPGNVDLQPVTGLAVAQIESGRLVSGTKFYLGTSPLAEPTFFCPDPYSDQTCLIPQNFPFLQTLECAKEPKPVLQPFPGENHCGASNTGILLSFNYDMCPPTAPYNYTSQSTSIYMICYDGRRIKNLYVSYTMYGASMLRENLLIRERQVDIPWNDNPFGYIHPNYYAILNHETINYRNYGLQTLVPPEDMPLATMRKATRYFGNYKLQHNFFMGPWDEIRLRIRNHAASMITQILTIKTGVFDIPDRPVDNRFPTITDNNEMKNIWVTQIILTQNGNMHAGLAILMNNFTSPRSMPSQTLYIDHLCGRVDASCVTDLDQELVNNRGAVRCCPLNQEIMNLFSPNYSGPWSLPLLHIPSIKW